MIEMRDVEVVAFDADDTLWDNEVYFRESERRFCSLLSEWAGEEEVMRVLYETETGNLPLYGYGVKSFAMSMLETVGTVTGGEAGFGLVQEVMRIAREQLMRPVTVMDGVVPLLEWLHGRRRLAVATKGDMVDQRRKLSLSGLGRFFDHVEVMCDKRREDYEEMLRRLGCRAERFVMIGNSLRSDVLPVLELGGYGVHVPYHTTWQHEMVEGEVSHPRLYEAVRIGEVKGLLNI